MEIKVAWFLTCSGDCRKGRRGGRAKRPNGTRSIELLNVNRSPEGAVLAPQTFFAAASRVFTRVVRSRCSLFSHAAGLRSSITTNLGTLCCHFPRSINKFEVSIHIAYTLIICWFICVRLEHKFNIPPNRVSPAQQCRFQWKMLGRIGGRCLNIQGNKFRSKCIGWRALCYARKCFRWFTYLPCTGGANSCCKKLLIKTTRNNLIWIGE